MAMIDPIKQLLADPNADPATLKRCLADYRDIAESQTAEVERLEERVRWWHGVAEVKQEERDRFRAALEMLSQVRHVSGSAQGWMRSQLAMIDAVLNGADVRDLDTVEAIAAGTWQPKES